MRQCCGCSAGSGSRIYFGYQRRINGNTIFHIANRCMERFMFYSSRVCGICVFMRLSSPASLLACSLTNWLASCLELFAWFLWGLWGSAADTVELVADSMESAPDSVGGGGFRILAGVWYLINFTAARYIGSLSIRSQFFVVLNQINWSAGRYIESLCIWNVGSTFVWATDYLLQIYSVY